MLATATEACVGIRPYRELVGRRVLITGLSPASGVDNALGFAAQRCRVILHMPEPGPEMDAVAEFVAEQALDTRVFHASIDVPDAAVAFARTASQAFGGLDVVVNILTFDLDTMRHGATLRDIEDLICGRFQAAARTSAVACNRMRLMMSQGLVLNVLAMPAPATAGQGAIAGIARTAFAAMIRCEAQTWSPDGIRVNGIAARAGLVAGRGLPSRRASEGELAAAALHLASDDGAELTGFVMDANRDF